MNATTLVPVICNCCNVLCEVGISYGDYVEHFSHV